MLGRIAVPEDCENCHYSRYTAQAFAVLTWQDIIASNKAKRSIFRV